MKLGKSLIITGLLFSSVLGSVNVGSITAMAATENNVSVRTDNPVSTQVEISFIFNGREVFKKKKDTIENGKKVTINANDLEKGYELPAGSDSTFNLEDIKKDDIYKVPVEKKKRSVIIKYLVDGQPSKDPLLKDKSIEVQDTGDNKVQKSELSVIPSNYEITDNKSEYTIINNAITVNLKVKKALGTTPDSTHPSTPATRPHKHGGYAVQRVRITFVDKNTNELVGNLQLNGLATHTKKIEAPKNYELVNAKDADIKFDTKGNKDLKISVRKTKSAITKSEGIVTTNNGEYKRLYTIDGKMVGNRALAAGTKWYTDQQITVGGDLMYRVATNEWVKAFDVK